MSHATRMTIADLELIPDRLDGARYELIDGELLVTTQPGWEHQFIGGRIFAALFEWSKATGSGEPNVAPGVVFSREDAVAPDVAWVSSERLQRDVHADGHVHAAPELMVEVLSPGSTNQRRDRELKLKLYGREGVEEYWLVDWRARTVELYRRSGESLQRAAVLGDADTIESPLLPGFRLPVAELWSQRR